MTRMLTVRGAIKRLSGITINEMTSLGVRDLRNIVKLKTILDSADMELISRQTSKVGAIHVPQNA